MADFLTSLTSVELNGALIMDKRLPPIMLPVFGVDAKKKLEIFVIFYSFRVVVIVGTGFGVGGVWRSCGWGDAQGD